ncbi:MAG: hypothetical protein ABJC98_06165 [Bacteroidota bacterium]
MEYQTDFYSLLKRDKDISFFFLGAVIFLIGILLSDLIPPTRVQLIEAVALIPFLFYGFKLTGARIENPYFKSMFTLFMISNAVIILRIDKLNYINIKDSLFSDFRFWPYLIPFAALFVSKSFFFGKIFSWIYWLGLAFFILSIVLWKTYPQKTGMAEQAIWTFSSGSGFILLTWVYHNAKKKIVAVAAILLALYISTMLARRNIMLTNINFIVFGFLCFLLFVKGQSTKKLLSIYGFFIIVMAGMYFFQQQKKTSFKLITSRVKDDSREYVFNQYFTSMEDYMWFGKGLDGTYYCPLVTDDIDIDAVEYRDLIECGYLQVILKGGYVNLALFLAIMVPAVFLGLFQSRNVFSKACGFIILLWLIDMGPYGLPTLSLRYILVWICVGVCYNKNIRLYGEDEIKKLIDRGPKAAATLHPITQQ